MPCYSHAHDTIHDIYINAYVERERKREKRLREKLYKVRLKQWEASTCQEGVVLSLSIMPFVRFMKSKQRGKKKKKTLDGKWQEFFTISHRVMSTLH